MFPAERPELARIFCGGGVRQSLADFIRPQQCLAEPGLHDLGLGRCGRRFGLILPAEPVNPTGRIDQWPASGSRMRPKTEQLSKRGKQSQSIEPARLTSAAELQSESMP